MSDRAYGRLAARLTLLKLRRSPTILAAALALPTLAGFVWARDSFDAGLKTFLFLLPHVFLFATQNMFRGEAAGGALENVLFIGGGYKRYFLWKNAVLALLGSGAGILVYAFARLLGPVLPANGFGDPSGLAASLMAGVYYVALGGLLGQFFEGGSNVLVLIIAQAAAFVGVLQDAAGGHAFLDSLASGAFSGAPDRLKFLALAGIVPNILVSRSLRHFAPWLMPAAAVLLLVQALILRRSELRRP